MISSGICEYLNAVKYSMGLYRWKEETFNYEEYSALRLPYFQNCATPPSPFAGEIHARTMKLVT